jgi:hypothetical protein
MDLKETQKLLKYTEELIDLELKRIQAINLKEGLV